MEDEAQRTPGKEKGNLIGWRMPHSTASRWESDAAGSLAESGNGILASIAIHLLAEAEAEAEAVTTMPLPCPHRNAPRRTPPRAPPDLLPSRLLTHPYHHPPPLPFPDPIPNP